MNDLLLKKLKQLQAMQQPSQEFDLGEQESMDSSSPAEIDESQLPSSLPEQDAEELIASPEVPEEIRKAAIQKVRQKYLGQ